MKSPQIPLWFDFRFHRKPKILFDISFFPAISMDKIIPPLSSVFPFGEHIQNTSSEENNVKLNVNFFYSV